MRTHNVQMKHLVSALALALPIAAWAQNTTGPTGNQPPPASSMSQDTNSQNTNSQNTNAGAAKSDMSSHDKKFIKEATMGGMFEVQAGQLALKNASSDQVRQLAQHIVDDHKQANQELMNIAQAKGVSDLPTELDHKHQHEIDRLSKLQGAEFDRHYADMMVSDHKKDIKAFEKEASNGSDPQLKQFAASTTPKLKDHLSMAESAKHASTGAKTGSSDMNAPSDTSTSGTVTTKGGASAAGGTDTNNASGSAEQRANRDSTAQGQGAGVSSPETGRRQQ